MIGAGGVVTRAVMIIATIAAGCGKDAPPAASPPTTPAEETPVASNDLTIAQQWDGVIHAEGGSGVTGLLIRDDDAYDAFLARLPEKGVQLNRRRRTTIRCSRGPRSTSRPRCWSS
jgi:hypothetical protein